MKIDDQKYILDHNKWQKTHMEANAQSWVIIDPSRILAANKGYFRGVYYYTTSGMGEKVFLCGFTRIEEFMANQKFRMV